VCSSDLYQIDDAQIRLGAGDADNAIAGIATREQQHDGAERGKRNSILAHA
jgi:hypothetical protein